MKTSDSGELADWLGSAELPITDYANDRFERLLSRAEGEKWADRYRPSSTVATSSISPICDRQHFGTKGSEPPLRLFCTIQKYPYPRECFIRHNEGMIDPALYSSRTEEWGTPPALFDKLNSIFHFQLDACASSQNALCAEYFTKADDCLEQDWSKYGRVWLNPPYGRKIEKFMQKAWEACKKGCLVVVLVPARTDTKWWHNWVSNKADVTFLRGRLRYLNEQREIQSSAPFPACIAVYHPDLDRVCNDTMGEPTGQ